MSGSDGDRWIAAQNIERFLAQLEETQDEGHRSLLRELIEREKEKLVKLTDRRG